MLGNIFSIFSSTMLAVAFLVVTVCVLLAILVSVARHPVLLRIGIRNNVRRPGQSLVFLCGLAFSTIIIVASFGLSDSFTASLADFRLQKVGNVDESVTGIFTGAQSQQYLSQIRQQPQVDAATTLFYHPYGARLTSPRTGNVLIDVDVFAVPQNFEQVFGPLKNAQGGGNIPLSELSSNGIILSQTLAAHFDARVGETINVKIRGQATTVPLTVRAILAQDMALTTGELSINRSEPALLMSLDRFQQIYKSQLDPHVVNTICIKNKDLGGSGSQAVLSFLSQLFRTFPINVNGDFSTRTFFDTVLIHPLQPDVVELLKYPPFIASFEAFSAPAARQFYALLPIFTVLMVGAGILLLILLILLAVAERRAELGMSRAVGLQRSHLVQMLLIEGVGYAVVAAVLGILLGIGAVALELILFSHLPSLEISQATSAISRPESIPLFLAVRWQTMVSIGCLSVLITLGVLFLTGLWISRMNVVAAIRDLEEPPAKRPDLSVLWDEFFQPLRDGRGVLVGETPAHRFARKVSVIGALVWGLFVRGPLCFLLGEAFIFLSTKFDQVWLNQLGLIILIASIGCFVSWGLHWLVEWQPTFQRVQKLIPRLSWTLIGFGWLLYGMRLRDFFFLVFLPTPNTPSREPSLIEILLGTLLPIIAIVIIVIMNADIVVIPLTRLFRHTKGLAPVNRTSLAYPLTFRFRTGVTVTLLSLVVFLILLLVTNNLGAIQEDQVAQRTGGFNLLFGLVDKPDLSADIKNQPALRGEISEVAIMHPLLPLPNSDQEDAQQARVVLQGHPTQMTSDAPTVVDNTFLSKNTMPLMARAQGFTSDRQVWDAVRDHQGYAVMQYDTQLVGLPSRHGFAPFTVEIPRGLGSHVAFQQVTIIGIVSNNTYWQAIYLSDSTGQQIVQPPFLRIQQYLIRIQPGFSAAQVSHDMEQVYNARYGVRPTSLEGSDSNEFSAALTLFMGSYLALGLLFGALSIGVVMSRAVVERRQQIGLLRALGFSQGMVLKSFLVEASFVITLSVGTGGLLALVLADQIAQLAYQTFPLPVIPVLLILLGSYLVAFVATFLPSRQASHITPAEALRYE